MKVLMKVLIQRNRTGRKSSTQSGSNHIIYFTQSSPYLTRITSISPTTKKDYIKKTINNI